MNTTVINMQGEIYSWDPVSIFFGYIPRSEIPESYDSSIFNFWDTFRPFSIWITNLHSHQQCVRILFPPHPCLGSCLLDGSHGVFIFFFDRFIIIYLEWVNAQLLSHVRLSATSWTAAHEAPLSMGFFPARILEWVAISFSRGSSRPRDWTWVFCVSFIAGRFFTADHYGMSERRAFCIEIRGNSIMNTDVQISPQGQEVLSYYFFFFLPFKMYSV